MNPGYSGDGAAYFLNVAPDSVAVRPVYRIVVVHLVVIRLSCVTICSFFLMIGIDSQTERNDFGAVCYNSGIA